MVTVILVMSLIIVILIGCLTHIFLTKQLQNYDGNYGLIEVEEKEKLTVL